MLGWTTTLFVGQHYKTGGGVVTKYSAASGARVAMRQGSTFYWLFSNHLGSTSKVANSSGTLQSQQLYKAWGETRYTSGTLPTRYTYTGQYTYATASANDFGLIYYGARFYDNSLGRWAQPDSIIPASQGVQGWDRFAFVNNNPIRYIDPTGHKACNGSSDNTCETEIIPDTFGSIKRLLQSYGVSLVNDTDKWTLRLAKATYWAVYNIAGRIAGQGTADERRSEAFRDTFNTSDKNPLQLVKVYQFSYQGATYTAGGVTRTDHKILFASMNYYFDYSISRNVVHELGHAFNQGHEVNIPASYVNNRSEIFLPGYQFNTSPDPNETFADFMVAWTYNAWRDSKYTPGARNWMVDTMSGI